jgi:hypothetical protein
MVKTVLYLAGLTFWIGLVSECGATAAVPQACPPAMAGKVSCISGEKMLCNKEFDSATNDFRYEWHAINESGQTFDVYSPFYKNVPGYTPAKCSQPTK